MAYPLQHLQTQVQVYHLLGPSSAEFKQQLVKVKSVQIKSELTQKIKRKLDLRMKSLRDCSELGINKQKLQNGCKQKVPL